MDQLTDLFAQMPGGGLIVAVAGVLIGLTLWVVGHKVLRPGFALIGLIFGAGVGWIASAFIPFEVPPWLPAIFVAILFGILAWVSFRLTMAIALALVFGFAAPMGVWAWAQYRGIAAFEVPAQQDPGTLPDEATEGLPEDLVRELNEDPQRLLEELQQSNLDLYEEIRKRLDEWLPKRPGTGSDTEGGTSDGDPSTEGGRTTEGGSANPLPAEPPPWVTESERVIRETIDRIIETWQNQAPGVKWSMTVSAISGVLFGLLLGLAAPAAGAGLVTALIGSIIWMACAWVLAVRFGAESWPFMPQSTAHWIIGWAAISMIGLGIQWTLPRKRADKSS